MEADVTVKSGTASGTLLGIMPTILSEDILRTVALACIGAVVSFGVTVFLKWCFRVRK